VPNKEQNNTLKIDVKSK
jgi:hypothetical protein